MSHVGRRRSQLLGPCYLGVDPSAFPPRLGPTDEDSNLELAKDSETRYLSEDSRDSDSADVDLASAVKQLREFIPGIGERAATTVKRMYRDDLGRFKEFKAQGELGGLPCLLDLARSPMFFCEKLRFTDSQDLSFSYFQLSLQPELGFLIEFIGGTLVNQIS